jgi:TorA maturation chaperone TorD
MYILLSELFLHELSSDAIELLKATRWDAPEGCNAQLSQGYGLVKRYFAFASSDMRTELAVEYARIFLAAGVYTQKRLVAVPYESVFTSEEHLMMQESCDEVYRLYLRDGFMVNRDLHEPDDHLGFELEYLAALASRFADAVYAGKLPAQIELAQKQADFITTHLLNWIPALRDVAERYAECPFYIGILLICEGYLQHDLEYLNDCGAVIGEIATVNSVDAVGTVAE